MYLSTVAQLSRHIKLTITVGFGAMALMTWVAFPGGRASWGSRKQGSPGGHRGLCMCAHACMEHKTSSGRPYLDFPISNIHPQHSLQSQRGAGLLLLYERMHGVAPASSLVPATEF